MIASGKLGTVQLYQGAVFKRLNYVRASRFNWRRASTQPMSLGME